MSVPDGRMEISILAEAPANSMKFRSAVETETTAAALIRVVSAVSRDDALAKRGDEIDARCAGERQQDHERNHQTDTHQTEVAHADAVGVEAEVDRAPHRNRYDQGRKRRHCRRAPCGDGFGAIARRVGQARAADAAIYRERSHPRFQRSNRIPAGLFVLKQRRFPDMCRAATQRCILSVEPFHCVHQPVTLPREKKLLPIVHLVLNGRCYSSNDVDRNQLFAVKNRVRFCMFVPINGDEI